MAQFNLTKQTTVATLKELFNAEFGAKLRLFRVVVRRRRVQLLVSWV